MICVMVDRNSGTQLLTRHIDFVPHLNEHMAFRNELEDFHRQVWKIAHVTHDIDSNTVVIECVYQYEWELPYVSNSIRANDNDK